MLTCPLDANSTPVKDQCTEKFGNSFKCTRKKGHTSQHHCHGSYICHKQWKSERLRTAWCDRCDKKFQTYSRRPKYCYDCYLPRGNNAMRQDPLIKVNYNKYKVKK